MQYVPFSELVGKTLTAALAVEGEDSASFVCDDGSTYRLYHEQDCCESVTLNEVHGDVDDLIGVPILVAEESSNQDDRPSEYADSWTWTFYRLSTIKGSVTLRWLGESNGYYSEGVTFARVSNEGDEA